ncbi:MAG TPA: serine/threonine-protein kinase, partial [Gammaproteobacteria bacterium]|nr:serine/threonine-protein kinase [Gammaproteobacteria bacterium]
MTPPDAPTDTRPEPAQIKALFGQILDAQDDGNHEEAQHLLGDATPELRQAVEELLHAHERASGVLLDDAQADAQRNAQTQQPLPTIEGYEIGEEIGRGGFGIVYRAQQRTPIDRTVAVKVLRRELVSDDAITRFRAESTLLARMNHESIARVYDAGLTDQGQPFVAMELIEAQPLNRACESMRLDTRQIVELMAQICDAIQHAHQRAVIHRDLKPAN